MTDERLLGRWHSVRNTEQDPVTIEFEGDCSLTYTIHGESSDQKIFLRYAIEGDVIITDQPSDPREDRTRYRITSAGDLVMLYDGEESVFTRDVRLSRA